MTETAHWGSNRSPCALRPETAGAVSELLVSTAEQQSWNFCEIKIKTQRRSTGGIHYIYQLLEFRLPTYQMEFSLRLHVIQLAQKPLL